jgi:hypothetical protein
VSSIEHAEQIGVNSRLGRRDIQYRLMCIRPKLKQITHATRDGSGDQFFALFNSSGCWMKGFAHEAPMTPYRDDGPKQVWPGVLDEVPPEFTGCLTEPAFVVEDTTFCIWRRYGDGRWHRGRIEFRDGYRDPDGSEELLSPLDGEPETYRAWAEDYYEQDVSAMAVAQVFGHRPLTSELPLTLNPEVSIEDLWADILEIGYPADERNR